MQTIVKTVIKISFKKVLWNIQLKQQRAQYNISLIHNSMVFALSPVNPQCRSISTASSVFHQYWDLCRPLTDIWIVLKTLRQFIFLSPSSHALMNFSFISGCIFLSTKTLPVSSSTITINIQFLLHSPNLHRFDLSF